MATEPDAASSDIVTAAFIIIGNEILSGRIADKNMAYCARRCTDTGVRLREVRVVADDMAAIGEAVNTLRSRYDHVFTSGGIGPTHDDITASAVAAAFGVPVVRNRAAEDRLLAFYKTRGAPATESRLAMADMPDGARLIDNPVSAAPGFSLGNVHVMAGVPDIFQAMLDGLLPSLAHGTPLISKAVTCRLGESALADVMGDLQARYPELEIGSYPFFSRTAFGVSIVVRGTDAAQIDAARAEIAHAIESRGATPTYADHVDTDG